jgi:hypothetical protein
MGEGSHRAVGGQAFRKSLDLGFAARLPRTIQSQGDTMNHSMLKLTTAGLIGVCIIGIATAQEKQRVSFKIPAENAKYTQQLFIDVGDVPGHQVRVFERRNIPSNPPMINGVKLVEMWSRTTTDYTDNNGTSAGYGVFVLENGDKFFARFSSVAQNSGGGKLTGMTSGSITGGTGKFTGIRGVIRSTNTADPKAGVYDGQTDIEYWLEK